MKILEFSSVIKKAVDQGRNKQGVIADSIAKILGYKSHHAIQGELIITVAPHKRMSDNPDKVTASDNLLVVAQKMGIGKPSAETVKLAKAIAWAYSVDEIDFDENLERTSGDANLDYYLGLVHNPAKLLATLVSHEAIYTKLVEQSDELDFNYTYDDRLKFKNLIPANFPKEIISALSIEILEVDRPDLVFASFYEDAMNLKLAVMRFISQSALAALEQVKAMNAVWGEETRCVEINSVVISDELFTQEKVKWTLSDVADTLYHLEMWMKENGKNNRNYNAWKADHHKLSKWTDEFVWESTETNLYISPTLHPEKFNEICQEVLLANEKLKSEQA